MIEIKRVTKITPEIIDAFSLLIPQLTNQNQVPDRKDMETIIESKNTYLFIGCNPGIVGTLTLVIMKTLSGSKAWIEDVVVDSSARGQNIGKELVCHAIDYAKKLNVSSINLTSGTDRIAANKLYQSLGFIQRNSNLYRLSLE
ncbi:ribosomal protein S18 acetylase RimI-like enzyme [Dysgonomonas hofstadii]|uniref:Ribosomal protein S18 acetylase RimI-like enzyme n=1 Tax=Dysgonomonas hofstadii TaxID=637886 RepID=A0A840CQ02_9BACT|nr:GNAT family N-acetyltransferase [Dysgonomonas hofstadii]MBB4037131.1 ribosomal protein S18 acetylase RimI-like enzyme [Dysgonomonas hofstadii]